MKSPFYTEKEKSKEKKEPSYRKHKQNSIGGPRKVINDTSTGVEWSVSETDMREEGLD